ncbi:hypothetical protein TA3x_000510 [Tundrisphaera sp. TA3]|uniref:hypothetical protein n=1 Tax=Tundrisphaera sp. TA3 TaxID=3435775 RepID=UPI003EBAC385
MYLSPRELVADKDIADLSAEDLYKIFELYLLQLPDKQELLLKSQSKKADFITWKSDYHNHVVWSFPHHGKSLQQHSPDHSVAHHESENKSDKDRLLESLREECDKLKTQNQFLQTRNAELRQSVAELRRAVARETQKFDQIQSHCVELQRTVDKLIDSLNDRAKTNDCLLSAFVSRPGSRVRMSQSYEGTIEDMYEEKISVLYFIDGSYVEQVYEKNQFLDSRLPEVGARLAVFVIVAEVQNDRAELLDQEPDLHDESSNFRRKALDGPTEF